VVGLDGCGTLSAATRCPSGARCAAATMQPMTEVRTAHTAELDPATLASARAMLNDVFDGDLTDQDWEHALGGMHALAWEGTELIGHAAVIQRRLIYGGRALRTGYIEAVGVRADRRGRGHASTLMRVLERYVRTAYDIGALASSDAAKDLYATLGWRRWVGQLTALTPDGIVRTAGEEGCVFVLPVTVPLDLDGELTCDWRDGDVW
jgi:aminoglycoside 2'-N-acetyltransferase I